MPIIGKSTKYYLRTNLRKKAVNDLMLLDKKMEHGNLGWED